MENRRHFLGKIALAGSVFSPLPVRTAEPERAAAQLLAFDYIETFYDRRRRHSLGYRSPLAFEKQMFPQTESTNLNNLPTVQAAFSRKDHLHQHRRGRSG